MPPDTPATGSGSALLQPASKRRRKQARPPHPPPHPQPVVQGDPSLPSPEPVAGAAKPACSAGPAVAQLRGLSMLARQQWVRR